VSWFRKTEHVKWASPAPLPDPQRHLGSPALDPPTRELYETAPPRDVLVPRLAGDVKVFCARREIRSQIAAT
jgi:hypothetical protein